MSEQRAAVRFTADGRKIFEPDGEQLCRLFTERGKDGKFPPVVVVRGPIGSGKTLAMLNRIWTLACEQRPSPVDGVRKTRWAVIRNTYAELEKIVVKDWLEWYPPEQYGEIRYSRPLEYVMRLGDVRAEIIFVALDRPDDVRKLRGTQFTGFFFNELQYTHKQIFDEVTSRSDRYPSPADGWASWSGVLADLNEPTEDHWLVQMTGEVPWPEGTDPGDRIAWPRDWLYLVQPPALIEVFNTDGKTIRGYKINQRAENLRWLSPTYYARLVKGKEKAWIDSRLMNRISVWVDGKAVWPQFNIETHVAKSPLEPVPGYPILMGMDFGRNPAVVFAQLVGSRWYVLDEVIGQDIDTVAFAPFVKRKLDTRFPGYEFRIWGDPKGADKVQSSERTSYDVMDSFGLRVVPAPCGDNDLTIRLGAVTHVLTGMHNGAPRLLLCPRHCRTLKVAMAGKYHFRKQPLAGGYEERPHKDNYSDICDGLQYVVVGEGEGRSMVGRPMRPPAATVGGVKSGSRRFAGARLPF
jgi:hypothetical protein